MPIVSTGASAGGLKTLEQRRRSAAGSDNEELRTVNVELQVNLSPARLGPALRPA